MKMKNRIKNAYHFGVIKLIAKWGTLELHEPYMSRPLPPQSSEKVRNNLFYSVLSFSIHFFLSNPFVLFNMTAQSQIESCLELNKKKSALRFVTLHFEVNFLYLFDKCHGILWFHFSSFGIRREIQKKYENLDICPNHR